MAGCRYATFTFDVRFEIVPPAVVALMAIALAGVLKPGTVHIKDWLSSLLWYRNYLPDDSGWLTIHYWSLAVEEHFYLLWPATLVAVGVRGTGAIRVAGIAIGFLWIWRWTNWTFDLSLFSLERTHRSDMRIDGILLGCMAALLWPHIGKALKDASWFLILVVALAAARLAHQTQSTFLSGTFQECLASLLIAKSIAGYGTSIISRLLEWSALRWLGRISYSLYLWQGLWTGNGHAVIVYGNRWPLAILLSFLTALLSYYFVEIPARSAGQRLLRGLRRTAAPAAVTSEYQSVSSTR